MAFDLSMLDKRINQLKTRINKVKSLLKDNGIQFEEKHIKEENHFELKTKVLKDLKIACVMDRFTLDSYKPECNLLELTPDNWMHEIDSFNPDLLFIESAWQGKDKLWYHKIDRCSKEFFEMASYCQNKNIPIVFWNKEDPVYTDAFMATARMADFVFTTDIDCVKKYKESLNHDNVFHLHFAAQPMIHNPIEKYERKDKYCFAGAYYHRYKERSKIFDEFAKIFIETKGYDIYDRNYKSSLPEHAFPSRYNPYIVGKLDPGEIDMAYKGYNYGVNMNSISQSQTMFARRAFEMLASNTVTVGNYSRGLKNYFGDLTICTNDNDTLIKYLDRYCSDEETYRKYRLLGLRKVLAEHLYEDRLDYIVKKVFGRSLKPSLPEINVVAFVDNDEKVRLIKSAFYRQSYSNKKLYLIMGTNQKAEKGDLVVLTPTQAQEYETGAFGKGFIAVFNPSDYYGKNYLLDLVLATRYGGFEGIGKANFYTACEENFTLNGRDKAYKNVPSLDLDKSILRVKILSIKVLSELKEISSVENNNLLSVDEFNYCKNYTDDTCDKVDDLFVSDQGLSMQDIVTQAEKIKGDDVDLNETVISGDKVFEINNSLIKKDITYRIQASKLIIESSLQEDTHQYIYMNSFFEADRYISEGKLNLCFNGVGDLDLIGVCVFYDGKKNKLKPAFTQVNHLLAAEVPNKAKYFQLGLRPKGAGKFILSSIIINAQKVPDRKACFLSRSNVLILTNQYPSANDLYRNMFVHKRIIAYKQEGYNCDVMRMNIYAQDNMQEFDGINVIEGQGDALSSILENGEIDTVCVHFLDSHMWSVIKNFKDKIRIIVWVHGSEIQPWWRREYNYGTEAELEKGKKDSESRMVFWKEVFSKINFYNIHFVFVSEHFAKEVMTDYKFQLAPDKYSVIHNCIDTKIFNYLPKPVEQRFKILTIKPFANRKYANDITTRAIIELSKSKIFHNLEFDIYGDGERFDIDNAPLKKFKNVHLHRTFLRQAEIAAIHKTHGIYIATTRMDAQGVSRDEAMSSGLVPIVNNVAAIPEFVDNECGILVPAEDYKGVAEAIIKLYNNPDLFLKLSAGAAKRVRIQTSKKYTIDKEIKLILGELK